MIHHYLFYIILYFTSYHYFECWNSCWIRWDSIVSILFWVLPSCDQAWQWKQSLFTVDFPTKTTIHRWFPHIFSFKADFRWLFPATFEATNEVKPHYQRHPATVLLLFRAIRENPPHQTVRSERSQDAGVLSAGGDPSGYELFDVAWKIKRWYLLSVHRASLDVMEIRIIYI